MRGVSGTTRPIGAQRPSRVVDNRNINFLVLRRYVRQAPCSGTCLTSIRGSSGMFATSGSACRSRAGRRPSPPAVPAHQRADLGKEIILPSDNAESGRAAGRPGGLHLMSHPCGNIRVPPRCCRRRTLLAARPGNSSESAGQLALTAWLLEGSARARLAVYCGRSASPHGQSGEPVDRTSQRSRVRHARRLARELVRLIQLR